LSKRKRFGAARPTKGFWFFFPKKERFPYLATASFLPFRQASEQYFTSFQTAAHFLRHVNGLAHAAQIFCGKSAFLRMRGTP
jgi:hypothetical protein